MKQELWEKAVQFHGHACPGLAIGVRAAEIAMQHFHVVTTADEDIVCVTENDACGVDGIQALLSCTLGKGNLIYRDTGKQAFSFFNRTTGEAFRICLKPQRDDLDREARMHFILNAPAETLFSFSQPAFTLPERARIFTTVVCECCGEGAPEHKIHLQDGKKVCEDCFTPYQRGW